MPTGGESMVAVLGAMGGALLVGLMLCLRTPSSRQSAHSPTHAQPLESHGPHADRLSQEDSSSAECTPLESGALAPVLARAQFPGWHHSIVTRSTARRLGNPKP